MNRRRMTFLLVSGALVCTLALAGPAMAEDQADPKPGGLANWTAVPADELGEIRGMGPDALIDLEATSSGNTFSHSGGSRMNDISGDAFSDMSGVGIVLQNSGDGNIFQVVTQVEVYMD